MELDDRRRQESRWIPPAKRFGIMTMVAKKQGGAWLVAVAQNTNAGPGAPEADDIKVPISLPKAAPKP